MSASSAQVLRRWFEAVWNRQRVAAIDEMFTQDGLAHCFGRQGSDVVGPAAFKLIAAHSAWRASTLFVVCSMTVKGQFRNDMPNKPVQPTRAAKPNGQREPGFGPRG